MRRYFGVATHKGEELRKDRQLRPLPESSAFILKQLLNSSPKKTMKTKGKAKAKTKTGKDLRLNVGTAGPVQR